MKATLSCCRFVFVLWLLLFGSYLLTTAQQPSPSPLPTIAPNSSPMPTLLPNKTVADDDVVRVNTNLVQSDVMVFDKNGRFVEGLTREQFELKVDGKPRDISFFDLIKAGTITEDAKIAAARGQANGTKSTNLPIVLDRGRIIILYIDDFHLSVESMKRTKDLLLRFIDNEIGQNDQAAIVTSSRQLGFLEQLSDSKEVLRRAVNKLHPQKPGYKDLDFPPMSEYQAIAVERHDRDVFGYFVDEILRQMPNLSRGTAEEMVHGRARVLLQNTTQITSSTLGFLNTILRDFASVPDRKLVLFFSDGFFVESNVGNASQEIKQVSSQATKSNAVIYTVDARGLISGLDDAGSDIRFDITNRLQRGNTGQLSASQDGLYALAKDTGGRAIFNTNAPDTQLKKAVEEISTYYLLSWASDDDTIQGEKFRKIEVSVIGRPDLIVQSRRGFISNEKPRTQNEAKKSSKKKQDPKEAVKNELISAIKTVAPLSFLPTKVSATYLDQPKTGTVLMTSVEVSRTRMSFENNSNAQAAVVDVIGVIVNEQGKSVSGFQSNLYIPALQSGPPDKPVISTIETKQLPPGLYQIRVATRDAKNGRIGNASTWLEIPDLKSKKFSVGSLLVAERKSSNSSNVLLDLTSQDPTVNVSRKFARSSYLRFLIYVYNATLSANPDLFPDVGIQVQVFREDQPVITHEIRKLRQQGFTDLTRLPYAAEFSLVSIPPGRYILQVTAIDRISKVSSVSKVNFTVG